MTRDRPLEESDAAETPSGGGATAETGGDATTENGTAEETEASGWADGVASEIAIYRWTPGGEPCAACGERVARRWRDGDAYVCPDCKEW